MRTTIFIPPHHDSLISVHEEHEVISDWDAGKVPLGVTTLSHSGLGMVVQKDGLVVDLDGTKGESFRGDLHGNHLRVDRVRIVYIDCGSSGLSKSIPRYCL